MKIERIEAPRTVMANPGAKHSYFAWPSAVRLQNGRLALAASGFRLAHVCPFGKSVLSFSEDEGASWTAPAPVIDTTLDDRDAGLCPFGESGLVFTSFNNTRAFQRSRWGSDPYRDAYLDLVTDEEEARDLGSNFRVSFDNGVTFGPLFHAPVTSPHGPTALSDGTLLWVGRRFNGADAGEGIYACRVTPEGESEILGAVAPAPKGVLYCEPHAIELADGRILCHIRAQKLDKTAAPALFTLVQTESSDGGRTWSPPVQILGDEDGAPAHLLCLSDGSVLCTYARRKQPSAILAMRSRDGGNTWDSAELIAPLVGRDLGYPATVELSGGVFLTVFYAHETPETPAVIRQIKWRIL